jgi:two-component system, cell cycle response regulator
MFLTGIKGYLMKILIADDDFVSRTMLAALLKKIGYEVVETGDGLTAWEELQKPDAPKLAILDWMMPGIDGLEIVRRIRSLSSMKTSANDECSSADRPYLVMLTSRGEKNDIVTGLDMGADDYLAKPFHPGELRARVEVGRRLIEMQTELMAAEDALKYEATHDPLTNLLNRRSIETTLSQEYSRELRYRSGLVIAICDIDFFKKINDTRGHMIGDEVLIGIAKLLKGNLRNFDHLGRFGGEEFLLIIPGIKDCDISNLFERLRTTVMNHPLPTKSGDVSITISIGIKKMLSGETIDQLLTAADTALYRAKKEGRNRICLFDEEILSGKSPQ